MQTRIDRQLRALALAKESAAHGARVRTISHITGLNSREVLRLLFPDRDAVPRGRSPDSAEWYHGANLLNRTEASIAVTLYRRLRLAGIDPAEALIGAYRQYVSVCHPSRRISFDRAFDLVAHTDGLWLTSAKSFSLVVCPDCQSEFLAACGSIALSNDGCPFCKLLQRYASDPRVQSAFPTRPLVAPTAMELGMLSLLRGRTMEMPPEPGELPEPPHVQRPSPASARPPDG